MPKNTKKILLILTVFVFASLAFKFVYAQQQEFTQEDYNKILQDFYDKASTLVQQKATNFEISLNPEYPGPNEEIKANVTSYTFSTDNSYITWVINGKTVEQGRGKKSITFKTGQVGTSVHISVSVATENGLNLNETKDIKIGDLDLLWQANTYTPPFYKGKALATEGTTITVTAVAQGLGSPSNLVFDWKRNFKNLPTVSGVGKNSLSFSFTNSSSKEVVELKISTINGDKLIDKKIDINLTDPEVIFYEESPSEGVLHQKSLNSDSEIFLNQPQIVVRAEPYFFLKLDAGSLSYKWMMNGAPISPLSAPNTVGLSAPRTETGGTANVSLQIKNEKKYSQQFSKNLRFVF